MLKKLLFIQKNLNNAFSQYMINNRILDWYEDNPNEYIEIKQDLFMISEALKNAAFITIAKLFDDRSNDSIFVDNICSNISSRKIFKDKEKQRKAILIADRIKKIINDNQTEISNLCVWRDKYLAHFDRKILNDPETIYSAELNDVKIFDMVKKIYECIKELIELYNNKRITMTYDFYGNSIDALFFRYLVGGDVLYNKNNDIDISTIYKKFQLQSKERGK